MSIPDKVAPLDEVVADLEPSLPDFRLVILDFGKSVIFDFEQDDCNIQVADCFGKNSGQIKKPEKVV